MNENGISYEEQANKNANYLLLLFIVSIFQSYNNGIYIIYLFMIITWLKIVFNRKERYEIPKVQSPLFLSYFFVIMIVINIVNVLMYLNLRNSLNPRYLLFFTVAFFSYIKYKEYGLRFGELFLKKLVFLLNVLSILNIYQIIYKVPLTVNFLTESMNRYQIYKYFTPNFRTISVFGNPIISASVFAILFLLNMYYIKNGFKYILQIVLLINIYSTMSRSSWLGLIFVLILYSLKNFKFEKEILNKKMTKVQAGTIILGFGVILSGLFLMIVNYDIIINEILARFGDSLSRNSTDISNTQRLETFPYIFARLKNTNALNLFFGSGMDASQNMMKSITIVLEGFTTTDNMFLTFLVDFGLIFTILYIGLVVFSLIRYFFGKTNKFMQLNLLIFIFINFTLFFYEGIGWTVIVVLWAFSLVTSILFEVETGREKINN